jgi:DNA-binding transcriptional ArsR family regulator
MCLTSDAAPRDPVTLLVTMAEKRRQPGLTAEDRARVFKALSDPSRVAIVDVIAKHGAMCGTELSEKLGISLALVCHHWDVLVEAGLVHKERVRQAQYCTLDLDKLRVATSGWAGDPPADKSVKKRAPVAKSRGGVAKATRTPASTRRKRSARKPPGRSKARPAR